MSERDVTGQMLALSAVQRVRREAQLDAVSIARGCLNYGGGYDGEEQREIYRRGVETVITALTEGAAGTGGDQVEMLLRLGREGSK